MYCDVIEPTTSTLSMMDIISDYVTPTKKTKIIPMIKDIPMRNL